jgi:hypothetical protein
VTSPPRSPRHLASPYDRHPLRLFGEGRAPGNWGNKLSAACAWCGRRFAPLSIALDATCRINAHLAPDQSPRLDLPEEAWQEPRFLSECPGCRRPLRFNPFIIGNR